MTEPTVAQLEHEIVLLYRKIFALQRDDFLSLAKTFDTYYRVFRRDMIMGIAMIVAGVFICPTLIIYDAYIGFIGALFLFVGGLPVAITSHKARLRQRIHANECRARAKELNKVITDLNWETVQQYRKGVETNAEKTEGRVPP